MKKVKNKFFKISNAIIAGMISMLGFASACDKDPKVEYGTPSAKFIVNGKVKSAASNEAIKNIKVVMQGNTATTDDEGKYQVVDGNGFPIDQVYSIQFQDIDGVQNGAYQDLDTIVEFKDSKFIKGDGKWYQGETSKELDIVLKPKK